MTTNRKSKNPDWQFDGTTISVRIPMIFVRRGGRKVIIAPDGGDAWAPARLRPDEALIRAIVRAHRWKRMLDEGKYRSASELAEAEGVTRSFVTRLMRLTLLAPDIVDAILDGRQPKGMQLQELTRTMSTGWEEQRENFAIASGGDVVSNSDGSGMSSILDEADIQRRARDCSEAELFAKI